MLAPHLLKLFQASVDRPTKSAQPRIQIKRLDLETKQSTFVL